MATTLGFKRLIDLPQWQSLAPPPFTPAAGIPLCGDLRNDGSRLPFLFALTSAANLHAYDTNQDAWLLLTTSLALTGAPAAGSVAVFHPTQGPRGVLAVGSTTTRVVLSTALPAAVGVNALANRGDGVGFKIRIIGNAGAGSSGLVGEALIVGNTAGTTPTIQLESALPFTPQTGDAYEFLSGRVYVLQSNGAAGFKSFDVATGAVSAALSITNLGAFSVDGCAIAMSEQHVPSTRAPGEGFLGNIISTAVAAGTITGTVAGVDSAVRANQFRNFQVRVVQDTTNKTAVGQRRRISSHTAGPSPVYTLATNWTVTPSAGATFVIELNDDQLIYWGAAAAQTYTYTISSNAWDASTTYAAPAAAAAAGSIAVHAFAAAEDPQANFNPGQILKFRGGAVVTLDVLDITAGATGVWSNAVVIRNNGQTITTGSCGVYLPATNNGRYAAISLNGTAGVGQSHMRLDCVDRTLEGLPYLRFPNGTPHVGSRLAAAGFVDGATKLEFIVELVQGAAQAFRSAIQN
jgi:hypothetical protein